MITEEPVSVTANELDKQIELLESIPIPPIEDDYIGSVTLREVEYSEIYLDNRPIVNRTQVYISKDNHTHIRRFLAVVAPNASISGYVNRIVEEHLKQNQTEISDLYNECLTKPL